MRSMQPKIYPTFLHWIKPNFAIRLEMTVHFMLHLQMQSNPVHLVDLY